VITPILSAISSLVDVVGGQVMVTPSAWSERTSFTCPAATRVDARGRLVEKGSRLVDSALAMSRRRFMPPEKGHDLAVFSRPQGEIPEHFFDVRGVAGLPNVRG